MPCDAAHRRGTHMTDGANKQASKQTNKQTAAGGPCRRSAVPPVRGLRTSRQRLWNACLHVRTSAADEHSGSTQIAHESVAHMCEPDGDDELRQRSAAQQLQQSQVATERSPPVATERMGAAEASIEWRTSALRRTSERGTAHRRPRRGSRGTGGRMEAPERTTVHAGHSEYFFGYGYSEYSAMGTPSTRLWVLRVRMHRCSEYSL